MGYNIYFINKTSAKRSNEIADYRYIPDAAYTQLTELCGRSPRYWNGMTAEALFMQTSTGYFKALESPEKFAYLDSRHWRIRQTEDLLLGLAKSCITHPDTVIKVVLDAS